VSALVRAGVGVAPARAAAAPGYRWAMLGGVWLVYFSFGLTTASMAPLVGPITRDLGLTHAAMGAVFGAWPLVYILSAVPCGAVLDRYGVRVSLALGAGVVALSGVLRASATSHAALWVAVAVFGIGGPLVSVGAPKAIGRWFEGKDRGLAMGLYVTGSALGNVSALALTNRLMMPWLGGSWRRVLLAYAAFAVMAGLVWLLVSGDRRGRALEHHVVVEGARSTLAVFAQLVQARAVRILLGISIGIFFFNHSLNNWLPQILRHGGMAGHTADVLASVPTAVGIAAALVIPRLALPSRRLAILVALFACAGGATLLIDTRAASLVVLGLVLQGVARGSMTTVTVLVLMERREVGVRHLGAAGGLFFSAAEIGGVVGPLTVGYLHDVTGGFDAALYALTLLCVVLIALASLLRAP
jgi:MFS transporter, CP family, cyanate transporter